MVYIKNQRRILEKNIRRLSVTNNLDASFNNCVKVRKYRVNYLKSFVFRVSCYIAFISATVNYNISTTVNASIDLHSTVASLRS